MLRVSTLIVLLGTIWLAYTAVPEADAQRRLDRIVGISLDSDPRAKALNATVLEQHNAQASYRSAAQVFGLGTPEPETQPQRVAMQIPDRKPSELAVPRPSSVTEYKVTAVHKLVSAPQASMPIPGSEAQIKIINATDTQPVADTAVLTSNISEAESDTALSPRERRRVVRHIQRELRRVGCYTGAADGVWGKNSKAAMGAFATKISATVPLDRPDYVALMLVETYDAQACAPDVEAVATVVANNTPKSKNLALQIADTTYVARTVPAVPKASPRRGEKVRVVRRTRKNRSPALRAVATEKPRVASITTRKRPNETSTNAERQRVTAATRLAESRTNRERLRKARENSAIKKQRLRRHRIARARHTVKRRRIASARARKSARRRAVRAQRQQIAKRRASRRYSRKRTVGFRRPGRAWVRHAFTQKR